MRLWNGSSDHISLLCRACVHTGYGLHLKLLSSKRIHGIMDSAYFDLLLLIGRDCQLDTSLYEKRDDFNFHITNFSFLSTHCTTPHVK